MSPFFCVLAELPLLPAININMLNSPVKPHLVRGLTNFKLKLCELGGISFIYLYMITLCHLMS